MSSTSVPAGTPELVQREPTSWTRPLQASATIYFVLAALRSVATIAAAGTIRSRVIELDRKSGIPASELGHVANVVIGLTIGVAVGLLVIYAVLALGSLRGWTWTFWGGLIMLALVGVVDLGSLRGFANPSLSTLPMPLVYAGTLLELADLALFVWFLAAVVRFGPWARRVPGGR